MHEDHAPVHAVPQLGGLILTVVMVRAGVTVLGRDWVVFIGAGR